MGAKDSKSACSEKIGSKDYSLGDDKPQLRTRKHLTQNFEGRLKADAEDYTRTSFSQSGTLDASGVYPVLDGKYSKQKDAPWVQFLVKKERERVSRAPAKDPVPAPKPPIVLHTSEYLKLLKTNEPLQKGKKAKADNKATFPKVPPRPRDIDISAAVDEIIQYRCKEAQSGKSDVQVTSKDEVALTALRSLAFNKQDRWLERKALTSKDEVLCNIVKMFESRGATPVVSKQKIDSTAPVPEEAVIATSQDDLQIDKLNRNEDLAEPTYWSEDERAPSKVRLASAHKLGHRPRYDPATLRDYVMQDLDSQLDHEVAKLLLSSQRLTYRHKAFNQSPQVRYIVSGLKEVCRAVKYGKVKCVFIAPDIEDATTNGGVDNRLHDILRVAYEQDVPVVFSLSRTRMGFALGKSLKMSVLGLLETKGIQDQFDHTLSLAYQKRKSWMERELPRRA